VDSAVLLTPRGFIRYASDASRECDAKSPQLKVESARRAERIEGRVAAQCQFRQFATLSTQEERCGPKH